MKGKAGFAAAAALAWGVSGAWAQSTPKAVEVHMETAAGADGGTIWLEQERNDVKVYAKLKNLNPGNHAIHVHQSPHCDAPEFKTAGAHFNPSSKQHGFQNPQGHHAGDLPINLAVSDAGNVNKNFTTKDITLDPKAPNSVFANGGTSIIVHEKEDDMKTDPSGNSGSRQACGVVDMSHIANKVSSTPDAGQMPTEPSSNH